VDEGVDQGWQDEGVLADTDSGAPAWAWALLASGLAGAATGTTLLLVSRRRR